ncbi:MAG: hypothetical protein ACK4WH_10085 [Phycisphaerales bacterium]
MRSADLAESFTGGFDALTIRATLRDLNNDGATMAGLLGGSFAKVEWNGETQIAGLSGFSAPVGGSASGFADLMAPALPYSGAKVVRAEFALTAQDSLDSMLDSITSIPAPGSAGLLVFAWAMGWRRRGPAC